MTVATVFGIIGFISGTLIPPAAQKIAEYKCSKNGSILAPDNRYTAPLLILVICAVNTAFWIIVSMTMNRSLIPAILISVLFSASLMIAVIDLRIHIIPNELIMAAAAAGIALQFSYFGISALITAFMSMTAMAILFTAAACIAGFGKVGAGDIKLAGVMGLALGYPGIITALMYMSASLLIFSAFGLILKRITVKSMIPFAPFMMLGMSVSLVYIMIGR
jgi:prepilin signal peptidase PulO-like enzyme (type II secretory pathway)